MGMLPVDISPRGEADAGHGRADHRTGPGPGGNAPITGYHLSMRRPLKKEATMGKKSYAGGGAGLVFMSALILVVLILGYVLLRLMGD